MFNVVLILPTGIGLEIGGHAGDGNRIAKLLAATCDNLITHPNVVNASDINEMTENTLYVEGSMLDRFLEEKIGLDVRERANKILLAVNAPLRNDTINAVNASRVTLGAEIEIVILETPLRMISEFAEDGRAAGTVTGYMELVEQLRGDDPLKWAFDFDALAVATVVETPQEVALAYFKGETKVNPYGGVEAAVSRILSERIGKPVAHSPVDSGELQDFKEVVDPRLAAEMLSHTFLHSVFKGLHRAPRVGSLGSYGEMIVQDIDVMVSPALVWGRPHQACLKANIPIIEVLNPSVLGDETHGTFFAGNYAEAAGIIMAMRAGIDPDTVTRPPKQLVITGEKGEISEHSKENKNQKIDG